MKRVASLLTCLFITVSSFAQTPKAIEADLLKSFKKIGYWVSKQNNNTTVELSDSVKLANSVFANKLQQYATRHPSTIAQNFRSLKKAGITILTSDDGLFRIYSWDDEMGGTMRYFYEVIQFKTHGGVFAEVSNPDHGGPAALFYQLHTLKAAKRTYYIGTWIAIESTRYHMQGVQAFSIENNKLNGNSKIIKTQSGLHSQLNYEYDLGQVATDDKEPDVVFEKDAQTIRLPLINEKGTATKRYITYKFTGKYFEKVKS